MWWAAGYLGITKQTLEKTYGHHHSNHRGDVGTAFTSGRQGRSGYDLAIVAVVLGFREGRQVFDFSGRSGRI